MTKKEQCYYLERQMHLNDYLKETGVGQSDFGTTLTPPATQALVSQWVRGVTRVTLSYALQIEKCTDGRVSPQDCADMYIGPHAARASPSAPIPA